VTSCIETPVTREICDFLSFVDYVRRKALRTRDRPPVDKLRFIIVKIDEIDTPTILRSIAAYHSDNNYYCSQGK